MIGYIRGKVLDKKHSFLIVDVSGIGYIVRTTGEILESIKNGEEICLFTHLAVRENSMDLYGFRSEDDLNIFEMLLEVSGIGPKSAITIISVAGSSIIREAVVFGDSSRLTAIGGVGKKTAEKIVVELSGKIKQGSENQKLPSEDLDVLEALKTLGYREKDIQEAIKLVPKNISGTNTKIKEALKILSNK